MSHLELVTPPHPPPPIWKVLLWRSPLWTDPLWKPGKERNLATSQELHTMEHVGLKTVTTTSNYKLSVCAELTRYPIDVLFHWLDRNTIKVIQGGSVNRSSINGPGVNRHPVHILQQSSISIVPYWSPVNVLCRLSLAQRHKNQARVTRGGGGHSYRYHNGQVLLRHVPPQWRQGVPSLQRCWRAPGRCSAAWWGRGRGTRPSPPRPGNTPWLVAATRRRSRRKVEWLTVADKQIAGNHPFIGICGFLMFCTLKFSLWRWPCIDLYVALRSAKIWQSFVSKLSRGAWRWILNRSRRPWYSHLKSIVLCHSQLSVVGRIGYFGRWVVQHIRN